MLRGQVGWTMLVGLLFAEFRHHCKALILRLCNISWNWLCFTRIVFILSMVQLSNSATVIRHEGF